VKDAGETTAAQKVNRLGLKPSPAVGTNRDPERPGYVRSVAEHGEELAWKGLDRYDWIDVAIEQRTRYEHRDDDYGLDRRSGDQTLTRTRFYLGLREVLDPFRFVVEFQDARRFGDALDDARSVNEADILQLYGGLFFPDAAGEGYPLYIRAGRMSFDVIDRRLVARNRFRNTTNAFDGLRITLGQETTAWEIDSFAAMPVERRAEDCDRNNEEQWFYGVTGYWRRWSPHITLEPYYFILDDDAKGREDREIHTLGLHGFGLLGETGWEYDFDAAFQFGDEGDLSHRAFAAHGEIGYTLDAATDARVAAWVNYATGDRDPEDGVNQRFDRLFGASHSMYGYSDLFTWQNMINPAAYFTVRPADRLKLEAFYRAYWLASRNDAWVVPGLRDVTGESGRFVGQEVDIQIKYRLARRAALEVGYAHFMPGDFVTRTASNVDDTDFFYMQVTLQL